MGKSSLINTLTEQNGLAKVSKEPGGCCLILQRWASTNPRAAGMTKLINHYLVNDTWCIVDLPGYGFARTAGKTARDSWLKFTKAFFINRCGVGLTTKPRS